jgi:prolyl-tRNA synthetase
MKYSRLFGKTRKNITGDAVSVNHQLLVRGGFIDQLSAGIYTWMPMGLKVLRKIENIIREELNKIGANEVTMPALIPKSNWVNGGRWDGVDILFKISSQTDREYGLGFSHEEVVTPLAGQYIKSYKDLPLSVYQIQTKFRDELRAKSGILRGREFGMKDMYSFHADESDFKDYYKLVIRTYLTIFSRMGLTDVKITEASGGSFTQKHSHEFNILTPAGEVNLWYCESCTFARNSDIEQFRTGDKCPECGKSGLKEGKAIEAGNIFDLGTRFSDAFGLFYNDIQGKQKTVFMGCYGIGTTRLVGAIVEMSHDNLGIIWPKEVAPFDVHLVSVTGAEKQAENIYKKLKEGNIDVLWDDRDISAGIKFTDADLIGIPYRLVVSPKTGDCVEVKKRTEKSVTVLSLDDIIRAISK